MVPFPHSALASCSFSAPPPHPRMLPASCMDCCVCPSCSSFSHLRGLLSAPRALLKRLVVFSARHLQVNNMPPGTTATFCLYLPFNDGDKKLWRHGILHTSPTHLAFYSFPTPFPVACSATYRLHDLVSCMAALLVPDHNRRFKTLSEGTGGRVVFLPVALQAFRGKLNIPFPTSAESLSGYLNVCGRGQRVLETPSESLDPTCSALGSLALPNLLDLVSLSLS